GIDGADDGADRSNLVASNFVSPGYFEALGIPLRAGRYIDETDRAETVRAIVLNESMARAHFGESDPIGRRIALSTNGQNWPEPYEIVGVVADSRDLGMGRDGVHTF